MRPPLFRSGGVVGAGRQSNPRGVAHGRPRTGRAADPRGPSRARPGPGRAASACLSTLGSTLASLLTFAGCTGGGVETVGFPDPPVLVADTAFVVTTDLQTGSFATFPIADSGSVAVDLGRIHSDAVGRAAGGLVWIVNRLGGDSIRTLDPAAGFATIRDCSVGNGSNPHDIAFAPSGRAYVPLYESATLAIVDPTVDANCAGFVVGGIDLSSLADADGIPEMDQAAIVGNRLYVTLERLDRAAFFQPTDLSLIAVIDTDTDRLIDADPRTPGIDGIRLTGTNPFTGSKGLDLEPGTGKALVTEVGSFGVIGDGGVERVDLARGVAEGFFVRETDVNANITDFVLAREDVAFALTLDVDGVNRLVRLDPTHADDPTRQTTILRSNDYLVDIELSPDRTALYLTDRTLRRPGIRIFSVDDGSERTSAPIATGLPPFDLLFLAAPAGGGG